MTPETNASAPWWLDPGFIAFDTETTGVDPESDRIVTAAMVNFLNGEVTSEHEWLLKLDIPIPPASTQAHGQQEREALVEIHEQLTSRAVPIVAFNATFDLNMLNANLARHGIPTITEIPIICPYVLDKHFDKYVKGRNQRRLMPTIERYGLQLSEDSWHGATADATITGQLFLAQMDKYDDLRTIAPDQLSDSIETWREQQEADFQAWLTRKRAEES